MRRLILALRAFWAILRYRAIAEQVKNLLADKAPTALQPPPAEQAQPAPAEKLPPQKEPSPGRSEALTLLATLQREARFVDFIMEPLDQYSDAQIGAAVRDIHRDCGRTLERIFGLRPIVEEPEGKVIQLSAGYDAARYRLIGGSTSSGTIRARVIHRGWIATKCQLPLWSGAADAALIITPAELQAEGAPPPRLGEGMPLPS